MEITINQIKDKEQLEFVKLDNGTIMSYGRKLPF